MDQETLPFPSILATAVFLLSLVVFLCLTATNVGVLIISAIAIIHTIAYVAVHRCVVAPNSYMLLYLNIMSIVCTHGAAQVANDSDSFWVCWMCTCVTMKLHVGCQVSMALANLIYIIMYFGSELSYQAQYMTIVIVYNLAKEGSLVLAKMRATNASTPTESMTPTWDVSHRRSGDNNNNSNSAIFTSMQVPSSPAVLEQGSAFLSSATAINIPTRNTPDPTPTEALTRSLREAVLTFDRTMTSSQASSTPNISSGDMTSSQKSTTFFANVSDELRVPLSVMIALEEYMRANPSAREDETNWDRLHAACLHLNVMVDSLIDVSRIMYDGSALLTGATLCCVENIMKNVMISMMHVFSNQDVWCIPHIDVRVVHATVDGRRLHQVLICLLEELSRHIAPATERSRKVLKLNIDISMSDDSHIEVRVKLTSPIPVPFVDLLKAASKGALAGRVGVALSAAAVKACGGQLRFPTADTLCWTMQAQPSLTSRPLRVTDAPKYVCGVRRALGVTPNDFSNVLVGALEAILTNEFGITKFVLPEVLERTIRNPDDGTTVIAISAEPSDGAKLAVEVYQPHCPSDGISGESPSRAEPTRTVFQWPFYTSDVATLLGIDMKSIVSDELIFLKLSRTASNGNNNSSGVNNHPNAASGFSVLSSSRENHVSRLNQSYFSDYHILVVEDNDVLRRITSHKLQPYAREVTTASNGADAVEKTSALLRDEAFKGPLLILMDVEMPVMNGFAATARIREVETSLGIDRAHRTMIVACTAHAGGRDADDCLASGMDSYMCKPFSVDTLRHILNELEQ